MVRCVYGEGRGRGRGRGGGRGGGRWGRVSWNQQVIGLGILLPPPSPLLTKRKKADKENHWFKRNLFTFM